MLRDEKWLMAKTLLEKGITVYKLDEKFPETLLLNG